MFLKLGVATHMCVAKILQCVAKTSHNKLQSTHSKHLGLILSRLSQLQLSHLRLSHNCLNKTIKSGSCNHLKNVIIWLMWSNKPSLTEFQITINKVFYMSRKVVFLCVANKNCLLKGVAGGKRLRTTVLDKLILILCDSPNLKIEDSRVEWIRRCRKSQT